MDRESQCENPIKKLFLLGPSRSGKSTLEKLLAGSPNVCPMFENINLDVITDTSILKVGHRVLNIEDIFYRDEKSLLSDGHNVITSTSPESIFHIDRLIDGFNNSFYILIKRDKIDIASEIFTKEYNNGNYYSYAHSSIHEYLNTYEVIWELVSQKAFKRTLEISFEDLLTKPQEIVDKISQLTDANFQLDNASSHSLRKLINPFREHYALKF